VRLEKNLLWGSYADRVAGSILADWPPVRQRRFRIIRASFKFLDGLLCGSHQLYTTNLPPDMRVVRIFGVEPEFTDLGKDQPVGILTVLIASAGFEELPESEEGEPPPEIPEMAVEFVTYFDPREFIEVVMGEDT